MTLYSWSEITGNQRTWKCNWKRVLRKYHLLRGYLIWPSIAIIRKWYSNDNHKAQFQVRDHWKRNRMARPGNATTLSWVHCGSADVVDINNDLIVFLSTQTAVAGDYRSPNGQSSMASSYNYMSCLVSMNLQWPQSAYHNNNKLWIGWQWVGWHVLKRLSVCLPRTALDYNFIHIFGWPFVIILRLK